MKRLMLIAGAVVLAGCMATTISKDYSVGEVKSTDKLQFSRVANLDDIEVFDKTSIPVVVKTEKKDENVYSPAGVHGLLWLCTLGIVPTWQTDAETYTMNVATPLGEANGTCTVTKRLYLGWVPYMLPFGSTDEDAQCEDELLTRLVSQYKKEWTAEKVEKMNVAKNTRIKELRAKADDLLAQKKWSEVIKICREAKNKAFEAEYMPKAMAVRLTTLTQEVDICMQNKDYQRVIDLLSNEKNPRLVAKWSEAIVNLIALCTDKAKLDEVIKKYGERLTTSQLTEISEKTSNNNVKAKVADLQRIIAKNMEARDEEIKSTILRIIKAKRLSFDHPMKKHDAQDIAKLLASINSADIFMSALDRCEGATGTADDIYETLIEGVSEKNLIAFVKSRRVRDLGYDRRWLIIKRITNPDALFSLAVNEEFEGPYSIGAMAMSKINNSDTLVRIAIRARSTDVGKMALSKINEKTALIRIALLARLTDISNGAKYKLEDKKALVDGIAELIIKKEINEEVAEKHVKSLENGEATISLYKAAMAPALKQLIFNKLGAADKSSIRESYAEKCKQMINLAKSKSNETFEIDGFYLGMSMDDAELLVMHHFPELNATEKRDDDGDYKLYVSYQDSPFCWANKDRKVYQFNFGKKILKKWYKYDASTIRDWAEAYSREQGIKLKLDFINRSGEVYLPDGTGTFQLAPYHVSLHQEIWTYKSGMKNYRLTYFGEREFGGDNPIVKLAASDKYSFISASEGTFRAAIEND